MTWPAGRRPASSAGSAGSRDGVNHLVLAFQPGDQCRTDEAAGAENREG